MGPFDYIFTLFGLILGLAVAEVLGGFARLMRAHRTARMGWLSMLLSVIVLLDLTTFWTIAWSLRGLASPTYGTLAFALVLAGCYYLAASLIIPYELENWPNLDDYFFEKKPLVLAGVITANWLLFFGATALRGRLDSGYLGAILVMTALFALLAVARRRSLCFVVEAFVIANYLVYG